MILLSCLLLKRLVLSLSKEVCFMDTEYNHEQRTRNRTKKWMCGTDNDTLDEEMDEQQRKSVQYWLESSEDDWKVANHLFEKGTAKEWSDIDVALVSPDFTGDRFEDRRRIVPLRRKIDSRLVY